MKLIHYWYLCLRVPAIDLEKVVKTGGALLGAGKVSLENVFKYISDTILDRNDCDSWSILADMKQWRLIRQEPQIMNAARKRLATFLSSLAS